MNDKQNNLQHPGRLLFFAGEPHACGYLPEQKALSIFADPSADLDSAVYDQLARRGFRRSGEYIYIPQCPDCSACMSLRVPISTYRPNRSQRRGQRRLAMCTVRPEPAEFNEAHFLLYQRYLTSRHPGGGMDEATEKDYMDFLTASWADTEFVSIYHQDQLIAVSVVDLLNSGLSAVYTFYEPDAARLGPGQLAILWLIGEAQRRGLPYVYLGYWVKDCAKMAYKAHYRPAQVLTKGHWTQLDRNR